MRRAVPLAALAIVVGGSAAYGALSDNFTNPPAPVPGAAALTYLTMKGARSGAFPGGVTSGPHSGAIKVLGLDFGLTTPVDATTGRPTGRVACDGVNFRKPADRSTPRLLASEATGEVITNAVFTETNPAGATTLTVTLTNSLLSRVHHVNAMTTGSYDDVTLLPQRVSVQSATGKQAVTVSYSCAGVPG
jgi:type VI secretion system Hcp family effector